MTENVVYNGGEAGDQKKSAIGLGILAGLIVVLVVVVVVMLIFDPFNIIARLTGRYDPIAAAVPADSDFFMSFNLLELQSDQMMEIVNAFARAAGEEELAYEEEVMDELDDFFEDAIDMSFSEDIAPWIGQYAGFTVSDFSAEFMEPTTAEIMMIVETRDKDKADEFLAQLRENIEDMEDEQLDEYEYQKSTIYVLDVGDEFENLSFSRVKNVVYFTNDVALIETAIDTSKKDMLAASSEYQSIKDQLPSDRIMTMYMPGEVVEEYYQDLADTQGLSGFEVSNQFEAIQAFGFSTGIIDKGVQIEIVQLYYDDELTDEQKLQLESPGGQGKTRAYFPEETVMYISGSRLDLAWENLKNNMAGVVEESEFEESMELFEDQVGVNPDTDLFPYLDGDYAFGIIDSDKGLLPEQLGVPLAIIFMTESSDEAVLIDFSESVATALEDLGGLMVDLTETENLQLFRASDPFMDAVVLAFGVGDNFLMLGTDGDMLEDAFDDGASLEDSQEFNDAWTSFSSDMQPVMYIDVEGLVGISKSMMDELYMGDSEELDVLDPIKSMAAAAAPLKEGTMRSSMIIFLDTE